MKSIEKKYMLILVASLALLLAGCGGGGSSTPPPADVPSAAQMAIDDAKAELMAAEAAVSSDMTDMQMAAAYRAIENAANALVTALTAHGGSAADIAAAAGKSGNAKAKANNLDMKIADAQAAADKAMAATAAKLYAGIGTAPFVFADVVGGRGAEYSNNDATITVEINDAGTRGEVDLTEDKKAMVADNYGWAGKRYTASGTGVAGTYEAIVYSNVEAPTPGAKFNSGTGTGNVGFDTTAGVLTINAAATNVATRIASPSFDHSAGSKTFKLPEDNPSGLTKITIAGSYYGVAGTYTCTPGTGSCVVNRAANGYTLGLGAGATSWTFTATNPDARVTDVPDPYYASYGWWIRTAEDGKLTVGFFESDKDGPVSSNLPDARLLNALQGTATYSGGAVGNYALSSSTGGTNDAGHFTARVTLQADFSKNVSANGMTGTIDQFVGADGNTRNWEVELMGSSITSIGLVRALKADGTAGGANDPGAKTKWTIDGTAGSASGQWVGNLKENGDDGVPKVGTGRFHSTFGIDGRMLGAFGVNKE